MSRKHIVICLDCGRQFDANKGGYYIQSKNRYVCKACGKSRNKAVKHHNSRYGQSSGAMIAKIAIGALFVAAGFGSPEGGWSLGYFLTALIIGSGLIFWGASPILKEYREKKAAEAERQKVADAEANRPKRCSECGATGTGKICEYCGSVLK